MKKQIIAVSALLTIFLISGLYYAVTNSVTSDEKSHIIAGYMNIRFNDYRFNIEHPPFIKQLAALPLLFMDIKFPYKIYKASTKGTDIVKIQEAFLFKIGNNLDTILFVSRLSNILISLLLGIFVYLYSRKLNGVFAGLISLSCFVFSPSFLGHSPLVTLDVPVTCFYFISVYFLMNYFDTKKNKFLLLTGIFLGLSLISKYSALILIPIVYILLLLAVFRGGIYSKLKINRYKLFLALPLFILVVAYKWSFRIIIPAFLIYMLSYAFYKKKFFKDRLQFAGKALLVILILAFLLVILDYTDFKWFLFHSPTKAYFKGFAYFRGHAEGGHHAYLLGQYSEKGWWYYFPVAMALKTPIATVFLIILGFIGLYRRNENNWQKLFLLIPFLVYLFIACFINKVNIGIRHILPVYPFLYVVAGYSIHLYKKVLKQNFLKLALFLVIIILAFDVMATYPSHLSYFNIACGGTKNGYKFLGDSNIAWGQDWKRLKKYIENNNIKEVKIISSFGGINIYNYHKIPYRAFLESDKIIPAEGFYVIDTITLQRKETKWADKIEPIDWVGGSLLVYNITDKDIKVIKKCIYQ